MSVRQEMLIEILERSCRLKQYAGYDLYVDYDRYFASIIALELTPKEERSRDILRRMLYCICDTADLNEMVSTLSRICYDYAVSLGNDKKEGIIIFLEEVIKAAPEKIVDSPIYFGEDTFQSAINFLYWDTRLGDVLVPFTDFIPPVIQTLNSLRPEQKEFLLNHIWKLAEESSNYAKIRLEEDQYGIIYKRIIDALSDEVVQPTLNVSSSSDVKE
ncbi:MAG: hypothetical protein LBU34_05450 [Planctomycetaceae bacterium]|jgi:hypothetical protein|nr:hypothetical protein [Planctomycetaceae bacterium]